MEFFSKAIDLAHPYAIGQVVNILQNNGVKGMPEILVWVGIFAAVKLVASILEAPTHKFEALLGQYAKNNIIKDFYHKTRSLPLLWHQENHSGFLVSMMSKAINAMGFFATAPQVFLMLGMGFFGPIIILSIIVPTIGLITF
ncbi:MAG: hypothetical protein JWM96_397 [Alphaproteobacteria bacterium]|nr:hypothetical protein [Alphaproteobacteria bacterium]